MPASQPLASLGTFRFALDTAAYQTLKRTTQYRWRESVPVGGEPRLQFLGRGGDTITLSGVLYPELGGGLRQIDRLRAAAGQGQPLQLMIAWRGGENFGHWCIQQVEETQTELLADAAPQKIEFQIRLARYQEDA